jgi:predicted dehydrogenase
MKTSYENFLENLRTMNVSFIGCGRVFQHHKKILSIYHSSSIKIISVCDSNFQRAKDESDILNCSAYESVEEMLDLSKPDLVVVSSPSGEHFNHASQCIGRVKTVLVEKPLAMRLEEIETLRQMSIHEGTKVYTAFQNRFNPAVGFLKKVLDEGQLGRLSTVSVKLLWCRFQDYYNDGWHGTWRQDGGVINQQAIHHVDAMQWCIGPVRKLVANGTRRLNILEAEDTLSAVIDFENGAQGTLQATTAARPLDYEASISVYGERGAVEIGGQALNCILRYDVFDESNVRINTTVDPQSLSEAVENGYGIGHYRLYDALLRAHEGFAEHPYLANIESSLETSILIHSLYRSIEDSGWISVSNRLSSQRLGI